MLYNADKTEIGNENSAILIFIHFPGHAFGHFTWKDTDGDPKEWVIRQMTHPKFDFMGAARSMGE